jgi:hypothetical protein
MIIWITTKIELDTNKKEVNRFFFKEYTVDDNGNTHDETEYDEFGNIVCKRIYRYFDTGEVKEYIEFDPSDELLERHRYFKNQFEIFDKIEHDFIGGQRTIKEFFFTDLGNAEKAIIKNENDEITGYEVYVQNEKGQIIEEIELDQDENEVSRFLKTYNENDFLISEQQYSGRQLFTEELFEYNEKGLVIKKILKNHLDKYVIVDEYKFDAKANMIYNCTHQNGILVFENKCEYNDKGELSSEEFFELDFWEKKIVKHERLIHERKE